MSSKAQFLYAAALLGVVAASPAPQQLDLAEIFAAPPATISGPALSAITQVGVVDTAALIASVTADVTDVATARITGQAASNAANMVPTNAAVINHKRSLGKRDVEKRDLLANVLSLLGVKYAQGAPAQPTPPAAAAPAGPANNLVSGNNAAYVKLTTTSTSAAASSTSTASYFTSLSISSTTSLTTTPGSSSTTSSTTACPTTPEQGTYCGFINPEDPCAPQPDGNGPTMSPDTVDTFMNYPAFSSTAQKAQSPLGYINTFTNYNASTSANSYLGLHTLSSYSPSDCSAWCDNTTSCTSFNIYIERDPSQNPCRNDSTAPTVWGYYCPNPSSITNYKCTLWGSDIDGSTAVNAGGWREDFNVVVTGSNGYSKTNITVPVAVSSYSPPQNCSGKAINGGNYWLGSKFFSGAYDPSLCAAYANATTSCNKQAAIDAGKHSYTPCQMFNSYHIYKNSQQPLGTLCALYNTQLSPAWATVQGSYSGRDFYSVRNSWSYSLQQPDNGRC